MQQVTAAINPSKLQPLLAALIDLGVPRLSATRSERAFKVVVAVRDEHLPQVLAAIAAA